MNTVINSTPFRVASTEAPIDITNQFENISANELLTMILPHFYRQYYPTISYCASKAIGAINPI